MKYSLVEFYGILNDKPGFIIPVFSRPGSNLSFAQNLDASGKISSFQTFSTVGFSRISHIAPTIELEVGEEGLLGFIDDSGQFFQGTLRAMPDILLGAYINNPICLLQVSSLRQDKAAFYEAVDACSDFIGLGRDNNFWKEREKVTFDKIFKLFEEDNFEDDYSLDDENFKNLENYFNDPEWRNKWIKLWNKNYKRKSLIGLAILRYEGGHDLLGESGDIFSLILDIDRSDFVTKRVFSWLYDSKNITFSWFNLYHKLFRLSLVKNDLLDLAVFKLNDIKSTNESYSDYYFRLYHFIYYRYDINYMRNLGVNIISNQISITDAAVRNVVLLLKNDDDSFNQIYPHTRRWLESKMTSTLMWAEVYLAVFKSKYDQHLISMGEHWLEHYGGNTNSWISVWAIHGGIIQGRRWVELATLWLSRARWDLKSWPNVFYELVRTHDEKHLNINNLTLIGNRWLNSGFGTQSSRSKIRKYVEYLSNI